MSRIVRAAAGMKRDACYSTVFDSRPAWIKHTVVTKRSTPELPASSANIEVETTVMLRRQA
jgi:hypothetical protein